MHFLILLSCIAFFFFSQCQHVSATTISSKPNNVTDRSSLLVFKSSIFVDPHGAFTRWNDTVHFCGWFGVTCGNRHPERVIALELPSLDLVGTVSPALANLTFLRSINLSSNHFTGQIPWQLANLSRLERLDLTANSLQGQIPSEFGSLPSLTHLLLRKNTITGQIPPVLANASSLLYLDLAFNNLSGVIPPSLGKLHKLSTLALGYNNLEAGAIPSSLWNLSSLQSLRLGSLALYGSLPPDIGQTLPNLQYLMLADNNLHGEIPSSLANASQLYNIQLATNRFTGAIPAILGRLQYLSWLTLFENQLEAKEPNGWSFVASLSNCTLLSRLILFSNDLGGQLPSSIANLSTSLEILDIGATAVHGSLPRDIGNLVGLAGFNLDSNFLSGPIPVSLASLNNLYSLALSNNNFSGEIPHNIGNLSQLSIFYLDSNSIGGSIPTSLGNCKSLGFLNLGDNKLTGTVPKQVFSIYNLVKLSFSNNLLEGSIPSEVGSLVNLAFLNMSRNKLSGEIPLSIGNCLLLQFLYLDDNLFQGSIPTSLSALRGLQEMDLSQNNFSGEVPIFLGNLNDLYILNLSSNNFEGELPTKGVFANISTVSVFGNYKLCGGISMLHLQTCYVSAPKKKHKSLKITIIIISVVSTFVCIFLLFVLGVMRYRIREKSRRKPTVDNPIGDQYVNFSYAQLVKATDGFSEANLIGSGSFCSVYRGKIEDLEHDIGDVAVKVFNLQQRGALKSFTAECGAYRNIRHRNLIKIITACSSIDFRGNDFKAIVFEFKVNGSLESWLHPEQRDHYGPKNLNLIQRINIAIDVAFALEYLHHHSENPIVHCDLKPGNILLDDDMMALVSDFGIVKFMKKTTENTTSSLGIKGTIGYIAPEYGMTSMVSTHGDVYSYGILLFELFTGKRPTDGTFEEGLCLRSFVELAFPERVIEVIDTRILQEDTEFAQSMDNGGFLDCVTSILGIGLSCTKDSPMERMEMTIVTSELKEMRKSFLEQ